MSDPISSFKHNPKVAWRNIDGEVVLIKPWDGMMLILNSIGSTIWEACEEDSNYNDLQAKLGQHYDVDSASLASDVHDFVQQLIQKECLSLVEPATT